MAATASAPRTADAPRERRGPDVARLAPLAVDVIGLLVLLAIAVWARTRGLHASFWMDEGISVGIASHPFSSIPSLLRDDGSPPLYYLILHVWMSWFGTTESATHTLSVIFATLTVPVGLWAGRTLFGARAGWITAALCTLNPYLTVFAQETRMYALLTLECMVAATLLCLVFVERRRAMIPALVVTLAAVLYTHGWGIFYCAGAALALLVLIQQAADRRPLLIDGLISFGAAGLLFAPWLPTLLEQSAHTAAPWSRAPRFGAPIQISRGLLGGDAPAVALALSGGVGVVGSLRRAKGDRERRSVALLIMLVVFTLATAWILSQITPAWTTRYFGVVLGPLLLLFGHGMAKARGVGLVALAAVVFFWHSPAKVVSQPKSDLRDIAATVVPLMRPGDLVVNAQPEQTPAAAYYFGNDKLYGSPLSYRPDPDPFLMNWYDALDAMKAVDGKVAARQLVASLKPGQHVLLVRPVTDGTDNWKAEWTSLIRRRSAQFSEVLAADPTLKRVAVAPPFYRNASEVGNSAVLYEKTASPKST
jgi:mannosyltransferase